MSTYTPNNLCVYIYAQAGCMGALIAARNQPTDPNEADYADAAERADFFAQEIDTIWGVGSYTNADLQQIQSAAASLWAGGRSPVPGAAGLTAAGYTGIAQALIAGVKAGTAQIVAEGINPNGCGGGGGGTVTSVIGSTPIVITGSAASPNVTITAATDGAAGSMSAADKTKLDGIPAGGFPARQRVVGGGSVALPVADGAGAVVLTLPAMTLPIGSKINVKGKLQAFNTTTNLRGLNVNLELAGAPGTPVGDVGSGSGTGASSSFDIVGTGGPNNQAVVYFDVDYTTVAATTTFTINAYCRTGGASPGDITVYTNASCATATQVG